MKKRTIEQIRKVRDPRKLKNELRTLAHLPDEKIDFSDIPEIAPEAMDHGLRGRFYRPIKKLVSIRLDADIIEWLKQDDQPYQTRANALLRREMLRATKGKGPGSDHSVAPKTSRKKSGTR